MQFWLFYNFFACLFLDEKIFSDLQKADRNLWLVQQLHQHQKFREVSVQRKLKSVKLPTEEIVEDIELSVQREAQYCLSSSIFSLNFLMSISYYFLPLSCLLGSFVHYLGFLFIPSLFGICSNTFNSSVWLSCVYKYMF